MLPDLVHPAGTQLGFHQREPAGGFQHAVARKRIHRFAFHLYRIKEGTGCRFRDSKNHCPVGLFHTMLRQ